MKKKILNIPNSLSVFRIILVPVFVWTYFKEYYYTAGGVLLLSGLTDSLDGIIARKFDMITDLGKILDPIADKLTQITVAVCIALKNIFTNPIVVALVGICILKDVLMGIGALVLYNKGLRPTPAKWFGKIATAVFYGSMILIVWLNINWLNIVLLCIVAAAMVFALINYFYVYRNIRSGVETDTIGSDRIG